MTQVNETLQELVERRLREMGQRRGRGENISLREAWLCLPEGPTGSRAVSYETVRRIRENGHHNIGDETADAIATILDVPVDVVLQAAGQRPRLGRFELPRRADRLTEKERAAVLGVVEAILEAGQVEAVPVPTRAARPKSRRQLEQMLERARAAGASNVGDLERVLAEMDAEQGKPDRRRA